MFRILNNKKVSKCISSLMLFVILFNNIIFPSKALALTSGPSQPEFSSFDSAGSSEMVNLFTGDFSYNIPLMDVDGYPINISYHASPAMDQEASWVGLGWNINSGAVNRSMRGLPDDFNGEEIKREINIKDFKAWGVGVGVGAEIAGMDFVSYSLSAGLGVTKSNYKGVGLEFFFEPTLSASIGSKFAGSLTAGLGVKASTTDGVDIYPSVGIGGQYSSQKATASIGMNVGANYNSREGVKSVNAGVTISASGGSGSTKNGTSNGNDLHRGSGIGLGVGLSASIPASSQGFLPQIQNSMNSQSYSLDFKLGQNTCIVAPFGYIKGYYAQSGLVTNTISLKGYGYLNSQNCQSDNLQDFSREKDGIMNPETPNMPVTNYSYDMFYASAHGMEMAFRPHRNDIGILHDNPTTESSFGIGTSAEVMVVPDANLGTNINTHWSEGKSGRWEENNDMMNSLGFLGNNFDSDFESAYLKAAGEKTSDDATFLNTIKNEEPVRVKLESVSNEDWKATNGIENNNGNVSTLTSNNAKRTKRAVRNNLVSYLRADDAKYAAISKTILSYPYTKQNSFIPANYSAITTPSLSFDRLSYAAGQSNHISEVMVTNPNGSRYVYGLPVYNKDQQETMFNVSGGGKQHGNNTTPMGVVQYSQGDASNGNQKGIDNFYERNIIPAYAHSYLLTELLSSDYVDRTGNGPSPDDYGNYTRFNYSKIGPYQWRVPYMEGSAAFNQGFLSDKNDDKGSFIYGTRDLWYAQSIESKNYVAYFVLNDDSNEPRLDARGVTGEIGGNASGGDKQLFLKEIRLYAKKDISVNGIAMAKPIKIVHFEYDYSLCPGVPNNQNTVTVGNQVISNGLPTNGKLTLKRIYFTYGKSSKGGLSPYIFDYCNGNYTTHSSSAPPNDNPCYNPASIDRWGYYKRNTGGSNDNNLDFPYTTQNKDTTDINARAWCLTNIKTPAGSNINVTYEADDYAYVQNKEATQMYKTKGMATTANATFGNTMYNSDYLLVDLGDSKENGVLLNDANALDKIKQKYFKGITKVYIKACVNLTNNKYEFVPLYADIEDIVITNSEFYTHNANNYYNAIIKLKKVGINDDGNNTQINPIVKAAFQLGRTYLPGVVFPGSQTSATNETIIKGMVTLVKDMSSLFSGINKALYKRNVAKTFDPARSIVRLYNPNGKKLGGGSRVKKIEINDNWNNMMSGESSSIYGQEYSYTTLRDGQEISSGVSSYEPLHGGDENTLRQPVEFSIKRVMAPNDNYFQEEPIGESLFPEALVGYSKVTVKNLDHTAIGIVKHATGKTEHEFYTAKDFPVITQRTNLAKQRVKPQLIKSLLNFGSTDKMYMSQGYLIKTNDMHGKPKGQKNYAEGALDPYSGITYYYKVKAGTTNQLDNTVNVIDKTNTINPKTIGQTTDFITDARTATSDMWGAGVGVNVNVASCSMYVPLVFVWPSFSHDKREFYSMGTTKLVNQYGLIDYAEAFDNFSVVKTNNMLYDDETGDVVLTSTVNNYDAPIYNLNYPAYWAYDKMGHSYKNMGIRISGLASNFNITNASINSPFLTPGDELLAMEDLSLIPSPNIYTNVWVAAQGGTNYLIKQDGSKYTPTTAANKIYFAITRSGRRNLQGLPMSSVASLGNPIVANKINVSTSTKVLSSSAVEYSENWQKPVGITQNIPQSCTPIITNYGTNVGLFWQSLFSDLNFKVYMNINYINNSGQSYWPNGSGYTAYSSNSNSFYSPQMQNLLMSDPFFLSNYYNVPNTTLKFVIEKATSIPNASNNVDFLILHIFSNSMSSEFARIEIQKLHPNSNSQSNLWNGINSITNINWGKDPCCTNTPINCGLDPSLLTQSTFGNFGGSFVCDCNNASNSLVFKALIISPFNSINRPLFPAYFQANNINASYTKCGKDFGDMLNPYFENIRGNWRAKYDYSYLVNRNNTNNIKVDGDFSSFKPFYDNQGSSSWQTIYNRNFNNTPNVPYDNWVRNNEVQLTNNFGNLLQVNDALNRRSATLNGYNHQRQVASASNAYYSQLAFDGFEDYDYITNECSAINSVNFSGYIEHFNFYNYKTQLTNSAAHTGKYSMAIIPGTTGPNSISVSRHLTNPTPASAADNVPYTFKGIDDCGLFGPFFNFNTTQNFIISVWIKEIDSTSYSSPMVNDYASGSVSVKVGTNILTSSPKKSPIINGWQKLEYTFTLPNNSYSNIDDIIVTLINSSTNRTCLFDDIRIHPFNSSMKTMVYDPFSLRLMAEHDDRNFSTIYEYDEEGTLVRVKKETEKGIYTIKETRSGLKKQ